MQSSIYQIKDFYAASFLIASGCQMLGCEREKSITLFNFEDTNDLRRLVTAFYSMKATIEPLSFCSTIRSLKSVIHSASNSEGNNNVTNYKQ
jgi:Domain of unknown function (DUF5659)